MVPPRWMIFATLFTFHFKDIIIIHAAVTSHNTVNFSPWSAQPYCYSPNSCIHSGAVATWSEYAYLVYFSFHVPKISPIGWFLNVCFIHNKNCKRLNLDYWKLFNRKLKYCIPSNSSCLSGKANCFYLNYLSLKPMLNFYYCTIPA